MVLGGAGIVMFGMVAATGIRILTGSTSRRNRNNLFIVAISIGLGMIPLVAPDFIRHAARDPSADEIGDHPRRDRRGAAQRLLQRDRQHRGSESGCFGGGPRRRARLAR